MHAEHIRMHKRTRTPEQITELLSKLDTLTYAQRQSSKTDCQNIWIITSYKSYNSKY